MKAGLDQIDCVGETQSQFCTAGVKKKSIEMGNKDYQWYGTLPCEDTK